MEKLRSGITGQVNSVGANMHTLRGGVRAATSHGESADSISIASSASNPLLNQARQLESQGDHLKAVEQYLKITPDLLDDGGDASSNHPIDACENVWVHAANLATKFLAPENSAKVTELVASRLTRLQASHALHF